MSNLRSLLSNSMKHSIQTLLQVFQRLIDNNATVIVIEHDLDVISNADYIIDMGAVKPEEKLYLSEHQKIFATLKKARQECI